MVLVLSVRRGTRLRVRVLHVNVHNAGTRPPTQMSLVQGLGMTVWGINFPLSLRAVNSVDCNRFNEHWLATGSGTKGKGVFFFLLVSLSPLALPLFL